MGKTSKPLTIAVCATIAQLPELLELQSKGHSLFLLNSATGEEIAEADLILSPNAWRMHEKLSKYIDDAVAGARAVKFPKTN